MNEREWLDSLKAGDAVIVRNHPYEYVATVVRRDKAKIVVQREGYRYDEKYSAKSARGFSRGSGWGRTITVATPERLAKIRAERHRRALVDRIHNTPLDTRSTEVLETVVALLYPAPLPSNERDGSVLT